MKIEGGSPQIRQGYRRSAGSPAPSRTVGQALQDRTQDRYVPSANAVWIPEGWGRPKPGEIVRGDPAVTKETCEKLDELAAVTARTDYTGMAPDEIFAEIWNRYDEAFDGNMIAATGLIAGPVEWTYVNNHFSAVVNHYADAAGRTPLLKVLGYDGMSYEEMETAIREKYAGKNTALDFIKMQSELRKTGILEHKLGEETSIYCDLIQTQFEHAFNPDYLKKDGADVILHISTAQWNRIADQPLDTAKLAAGMREQLGRIRSANGYTDEIVKTMEDCMDLFVKGVIDDSLDRLLDGEKK